MSRYIIELPDYVNHVSGCQYENGEIMKETHFPVSCLTPHTDLDREAIENEVWEFVRRILGMPKDKYCECFDIDDIADDNFACKYSYQEAKKVYEEWKKEEICVGDEVWISEEGQNGVVTKTTDSGFLIIIDKDGDSIHCYDTYVVKTGRHYPEIKKLLKEMRNDNAKDFNCY